MKRSHMLAALALALLVSLTGCGEGAKTGSPSSNANEITGTALPAAAPLTPLQSAYTAEDTDASWNAADAIPITLNGSAAQSDSAAVQTAEGLLTITAGGTYLLSGSFTGQLLIDANKTDTVRLILNGVTLTNPNSAALYAKQAKKTILTLAEGTQNEIADGASEAYSDSKDEPDAAIFTKDSLTINGSGALTVHGNYNNGIGSKDALVCTGGTLTVTAVNDGLRGRDSVTIREGSFTITAGGDGIQSNNDEDAAKGWILLEGGDYQITAAKDGIQAETQLQLDGGSYQLTTGGGSANAESKHSADTFGKGGAQTTTVSTATTESQKGLKGGTGLLVQGGTLRLDCADDALHSNGNAAVTGGALTLFTGDDGIHADAACTVSGGTIEILTSYEGIEGASVNIAGGDIRLTASDDGLNAAGGSDSDSGGGPADSDSFRSDSGSVIQISDGLLIVNASGDGLDSNGDLLISGGTVLVNGPADSGNGALDYGGECQVTGGILLAAGSAGMAQLPAGSSTQNTLAVTYTTAQAAGTLFSLTNARGAPVAAFAPAKEYQSVIFSSPALTQGESYTLSTGGNSSGDETAGYSGNGTVTGGRELAKVALSDRITNIAEDGSAAPVRGGMGGGMGGGGRTPPNGGAMPDGGMPPDRETPEPPGGSVSPADTGS